MEPPLWSEGASPWPHEREALAFVRSHLPNHEPYRAWTNVEFIAEDGSVNEVDLLVVTPVGLFLVEIKSFPGTLDGNGQRWRLRYPSGTERLYDHPLLLTNTKAKRLRSLLTRQRVFYKERPPWVTPLVFLSSQELDCRLRDVARTGVCGRDAGPVPLGAPASSGPDAVVEALPGIVATLKDPTKVGQRGHAVNKPLSAKIAMALESAGLQASNRGRKVGDWELGGMLDEGPGWQDFSASRPRIDTRRRARVYLAGTATSAEEQDRLRREAETEFRAVQGLHHEGIAQPLDLVQAERGPALLFDISDGEERLDLWAVGSLASLPLYGRIELVRQLAEAIAHAHAHRVTHRAMSARSVLVRPAPDGGLPQLVIGHWQAGARELATTLTRHPDSAGLGTAFTERLDSTEQVYLAPEAFSVDKPDGAALDVFSLGALAYLIFAGRPPASDLPEREALLSEHRGLAIDAADNVPECLADIVFLATDPVPSCRVTVREVLEMLDGALQQLTAPTGEGALDDEREEVVDPLKAHQGALLEGGWTISKRLGSGSTAVALLCDRAGSAEREVLKVAKDEAHAERLRDEARSLEQLHHAGIVRFLGVERIGGRTTLRLSPAGDPDDKVGMTLADRLAAQGPLGLDLLERFGDDLMEAVAYLESEGVAHRDIKPDNLGVRPRRGKSLHLVLFDFSLARAPETSLSAGTPGYLDPFLAERPGRRWDAAAERYAVGVTLYEMATGIRPVWGDGRTDPLHVGEDQPRLDHDLLDPAVRDGLVRFFAKSLCRDPKKRFDTTDQMRQAWRAIFAAGARPATITDEGKAADAEVLDRLADAADGSTSIVGLGLSGAAVSALERLGLGTVAQLLAYPTADWNRAPGVGTQVRREVVEAIGRLRARLDVETTDPAASIDRLASALVPKPVTPQAQSDAPILTALLGLDGGGPTGGLAESQGWGAPAWLGPADLAPIYGVDRAAYEDLLARARSRWSKQAALTQVRNELYAVVDRAGGVVPADEVALALLAQRGSTATGPDRLRRARAVLRAALETEAAREKERFTWRRLGGGASAVIAVRGEALEGEELADYAASLGTVADQLAHQDPLPSPAAALDKLRNVPLPLGLSPLDNHRLARLATAASATAATSSRLEVYPRQMPASRAVRLARAALLGGRPLTQDEVRARVRTRFPAAEALPQRPALDDMLREEAGMEWFMGGPGPSGALLPPGFRARVLKLPSLSTGLALSGTRLRTGTAAGLPDEERAEADRTDDRLRRHALNGGYLVLTVQPRRYPSAISSLAKLGARVVNLDELLITSLRDHAKAKKMQWDTAIIATDAAGPASEMWPRLLTVFRSTLPALKASLLAGPEHLLLTYPGLLARYNCLGLLDELRERARQPEPGQSLRTVWALVPAEDSDALPTLGGQAVPVSTSAEHMAIPQSWLRNFHGTTQPGAKSK